MRVQDPLLGTRAEVSVTAATVVASEATEIAVLEEVARLEQIFTVFDLSLIHI